MLFQKFLSKTKNFSKTSAFIQNSTRLRNTVLSIIRAVEDGNTKMGISAEQDVMMVVDREIEKAREEITNWQDHDTDYIAMANVMLSNITFDLLASGEYHIGAGQLNEMGPANRLKDIYKSTLDWGLSHNQISKEDYNESLKALKQRIKSI